MAVKGTRTKNELRVSEHPHDRIQCVPSLQEEIWKSEVWVISPVL